MDAQLAKEKACAMRKDIIEMLHAQAVGIRAGRFRAPIFCLLCILGGLCITTQKILPIIQGIVLFWQRVMRPPALYAVLAEAGYFPHEELMTLRKLGTRLQGHPDCNLLEGVEVSTGSLGQGLSISAGLAAGLRLENNNARVFTVMGDGECQEGQVWEAAQFAAHQKLGNLIAIVDANGLQIDGKVEDVCSSGSLNDKFAAFGWEVYEANGHDIDELTAFLWS